MEWSDLEKSPGFSDLSWEDKKAASDYFWKQKGSEAGLSESDIADAQAHAWKTYSQTQYEKEYGGIKPLTKLVTGIVKETAPSFFEDKVPAEKQAENRRLLSKNLGIPENKLQEYFQVKQDEKGFQTGFGESLIGKLTTQPQQEEFNPDILRKQYGIETSTPLSHTFGSVLPDMPAFLVKRAMTALGLAKAGIEQAPQIREAFQTYDEDPYGSMQKRTEAYSKIGGAGVSGRIMDELLGIAGKPFKAPISKATNPLMKTGLQAAEATTGATLMTATDAVLKDTDWLESLKHNLAVTLAMKGAQDIAGYSGKRVIEKFQKEYNNNQAEIETAKNTVAERSAKLDESLPEMQNKIYKEELSKYQGEGVLPGFAEDIAARSAERKMADLQATEAQKMDTAQQNKERFVAGLKEAGIRQEAIDALVPEKLAGSKDSKNPTPLSTEDQLAVHTMANFKPKMFDKTTPFYWKILRTGGETAKNAIIDSYRRIEASKMADKKEAGVLHKEIKKNYTRPELENVGNFLASQDPMGVKAVLRSGKEPIKDVAQLSDKEAALAQLVAEQLASQKNSISKVNEVFGIKNPEWIKEYFPLMRQISLSERMGMSTPFQKEIPNVGDTTTVSNVFLKKRESGDFKANLNAADVLHSYLHQAADYKYNTLWVKKIEKMFNEPLEKYGKPLVDQSELAKEYVYNRKMIIAGKQALKPWEVVIRKLNRNYVLSSLAWNTTSLLSQLESVAVTASEYGFVNILKLKSKESELYAKQSNVLRERGFGSEAADKDYPSLNRWFKTTEKINDVGMYLFKAADYQMAKITWKTAFDVARQAGLSIKDSFQKAEDAVVKTQASSSQIDISPMQTTTTGKIIGAFQTYTLNRWMYFINEVIGKGNKNMTVYDAILKTGKYLAYSSIVAAAYQSVGLRPPTPNPFVGAIAAKDKQDPAVEFVKGLVGNVPFVGGITAVGGRALLTPIGQAGYDIVDTMSGRPAYTSPLETLAKVANLSPMASLMRSRRKAEIPFIPGTQTQMWGVNPADYKMKGVNLKGVPSVSLNSKQNKNIFEKGFDRFTGKPGKIKP